MADELTERKENLVAVVESHDLGDLIKPLVREIHLFDSFISGTTHLKDSSILDEVKAGESLKLLREESRFEDNAIAILTEDGRRLGYVPEKDTIIFARLMDAGKLLKARITKIEQKGSFRQIGIGIYLIDF